MGSNSVTNSATNGTSRMRQSSYYNSSKNPANDERDSEECIQQLTRDGGYAWFIACASFFSYFIFCGFVRTEGIFFLLFRERFNKNAQTTAWLGAIVAALQCFNSPLVTAFSNRFSVRSSIILASLFSSIGFALTAYAPNFYLLLVSFSVLQGSARCLAMTSSVVIVNQYFKSRRGLALAIATSGCGIGGAVLLPFIQWLVDSYDYTGTFLIIAAVTLNGLVCAFMSRPFSFHEKLVRMDWKNSNYQEATVEDLITEGDDEDNDTGMNKRHKHWAGIRHKDKHDEEKVRLNQESSSDDEEEKFSKGKVAKSARKNKYNSLISEAEKLENHDESSFKNRLAKMCKWCNKHMKECLSICFPVDSYEKKKSDSKMFHFSVFKNPAFILVCFSNLINQSANRNTFGFLPVLAYEKGFNDAEVALIQACFQVSDVVGKIVCGFVLDLPSLVRFQSCSFVVFQVISGICITLIPITTDLALFSTLSASAGFFTSAIFNLRVLILADLFDDEVLASSFGAMLFFQGFSFMAATPIAGALKDLYGSFDYAFYLSGVSFIVAAALGLGSMIIAHNMNKSKDERSSEQLGKNSRFKYWIFGASLCRWRVKNLGNESRVSLASDCVPLVEKRLVQP